MYHKMLHHLTSSGLLAAAYLVAIATASPVQPRQAGAFTYYNLKTPLSAPCDLDTGPDGAIWVRYYAATAQISYGLFY